MLTASLCTQVGIWIRNVAILLFVMEKIGGNAPAISCISLAECAPIFLFSLIGGTCADRWAPKRTMVWCDLVSVLSIFVLAIALLYSTWQVVFGATLVSASVSQLSYPAGIKLCKMHIPSAQMQAGMSCLQMLIAACMMLGPLAGTFVFQQGGLYLSMTAVGLAFLASALVLTFLPPDRLEPPASAATLWHDMRLGWRYMWSHPMLVTLGGSFMAVGLAFGCIHLLGVLLITERLSLEAHAVQWLFAAHGTVMIISGAVALLCANRLAHPVLVMLGMGIMAVGICVMGWSIRFWLTLMAEFMTGLAMPSISMGMHAIILNTTAAAFVGRVYGILTPLFMGAMLLTMSAAGVLKEQFSLCTLYQAAAALCLIGMLVMVPLCRLPLKMADAE